MHCLAFVWTAGSESVINIPIIMIVTVTPTRGAPAPGCQEELHQCGGGGGGGVGVRGARRGAALLDGGGVIVLEHEAVVADLLLRDGRHVHDGPVRLRLHRLQVLGRLRSLQGREVHPL